MIQFTALLRPIIQTITARLKQMKVDESTTHMVFIPAYSLHGEIIATELTEPIKVNVKISPALPVYKNYDADRPLSISGEIHEITIKRVS